MTRIPKMLHNVIIAMLRTSSATGIMHMRVVIISDTHNQLDRLDVPDGDVLIHCGDFTMGGTPQEIEKFNEHLQQLPHRHKIVVAGNHEFLFESHPDLARSLLTAATYLQDTSIEIDGIVFYGSPWQPEFHNWAFNVPADSDRMRRIWERIPDNTDVLITHGPPFGILDNTMDNRNVGCRLLRNRVLKITPKLHCFGHIHSAYGTQDLDGITFINAANLNEQYRPANAPIEIELPDASAV
jgi:Icc-related predicted phosphoesterase